MKRKVKCIWVHFKGDAYAMQFWDCKTLGDCLRRFGMKRNSVSSWWREYEDQVKTWSFLLAELSARRFYG